MEFRITRAAPDELKHYGIPGQKKGFRRFQDENGKLTAAGRQRYGIEEFQPAKDVPNVSEQRNHTVSYAKKDSTGRYGYGNIDLNNRKVVKNSDGSISTERSFSVNIDGKETLLPTVVNGKVISEDEAIDHYIKTGEHLGRFDTVEEAERYAEELHKRQDWYYNEFKPEMEKKVGQKDTSKEKVKKQNAQKFTKSIGIKGGVKAMVHSDELTHFGIKGQKWGVRRFENYDGTLTEEGKARYYTDSERKNVADATKEYSNIDVFNRRSDGVYTYDYNAAYKRQRLGKEIVEHPAIHEIVSKMSASARKEKELMDTVEAEEKAFYNNKEVYEKYLNQAVNHFIKEVGPNWGTREQAYNWFKYDDGDQGERSSIELYKKSPEGKKLRDAERAHWDSYKAFVDECESYVKEYLGNYGDEILSQTKYSTTTITGRLSGIVVDDLMDAVNHSD